MSDTMEVENIEPTEEELETIDNTQVLQKYKSASEVVNETIAFLIKECQPGKKVLDLCVAGDKFITTSAKSKLKKLKKIPRGIAFPTCINVNSIVCHYSPIDGDSSEDIVLKDNDTVRIDLGAQIDGYIAVGATTFKITNSEITGKEGDCIVAAQTALQAAMREMKPGHKNTDVSKVVNQVATCYGVNACEGVLSHQLKRFVIDGSQVILLRPTSDQTVEEFEFQPNEVYGLDIVLSTGKGKLKEGEQKTTIYKKRAGSAVSLKRKASRQVYNDIRKFENLPFTVRSLDEKYGRIGIVELYRNGLVDTYPVLKEKAGEFVVHLKTTVLITPSAVKQGTEVPLQSAKSDKKVSKEVEDILNMSLKISNKKKKKSKKTDDKMETDE